MQSYEYPGSYPLLPLINAMVKYHNHIIIEWLIHFSQYKLQLRAPKKEGNGKLVMVDPSSEKMPPTLEWGGQASAELFLAIIFPNSWCGHCPVDKMCPTCGTSIYHLTKCGTSIYHLTKCEPYAVRVSITLSSRSSTHQKKSDSHCLRNGIRYICSFVSL